MDKMEKNKEPQDYELQINGLINAVIELLKVKVIDSHCYRNLIDNIAAYYTGSVNKTKKWDTKKLKEHCCWTDAAKNTKVMEKEHVIPMSQIITILLALDDLSPSSVKKCIQKYAVYCMVTKEEHSLLNTKYQSKMPAGFWTKGDELYDEPFARYIALDIKVDYDFRYIKAK